MRHLAFNLEKALWRASQRQHLHIAEGRKPVAKVVIFMHMYNFSLFNCPPFKVRATPLHAHWTRGSMHLCVFCGQCLSLLCCHCSVSVCCLALLCCVADAFSLLLW